MTQMSTADLYVKINSMPEHLRKELIDFMEFLLQRNECGKSPLLRRRSVSPD